MKTLTQYRAAAAAALILTLTLAGCGGGGDGTAPATTSTTTQSPAPAVDVYSYEPPAPTYAPGSYELTAFNLLNAERSRCGFGKLKQSVKLDQAAHNHAQWIMLNNFTVSHNEQPGTPGFTGVNAADRAFAVGYDGYVGEEAGAASKNDSTTGNIGEAWIRLLLSTPIHGSGLVSPGYGSDFGIGFSDASPDPLWASLRAGDLLTGNLKSEWDADAQRAASAYAPGEVKTYPCDGTVGIMTKIANEIPNPVPDRNLATNPTGSAIVVLSAPGTTLKLGGSTLIHIASGAGVPMRAGVTDGVGSVVNLGPDTGFYLPDVPLAPNARYQFTFSGTVDGKPFTKTFSFETGPI
jgi:uncharacterized protein YkwD